MAVLRTQTALVAIEPDGPPAMIASSMPAQANSDDHLIELWLHPRAPRTCIAYLADIAAFRALMTKPCGS